MQPHRQQPTRLLCPWVSPSKNTRVGCHFLLQCMKVKSEREVAQSRPTLCDSMDCSLPGSSVHRIFQARVLEWGAKYTLWLPFIFVLWISPPLCFSTSLRATHSSGLYSNWNDPPSSAAAAAAKSLQSCPTLCDPIDGSPPGSPIPGILQARTLEWGAISFSNAWKWKGKVKSLSRVQLLATPWTADYQALPSMGFSRQEYWNGVPLPPSSSSD